MEAESFFARWAQRNAEAAEEKRAAARQVTEQQPLSPPTPPPPPPTLEDVAGLTPDSDFKPFVARGVDENVRRSALKKLFADPHFNVMDGLDVYIEDYNKFEPIPAAMLAALNHARGLLDPLGQLGNPLMRLLDAEDEKQDEKHEAVEALPAAEKAAAPEAAGEAEDPPEDDPHDDPV
jgi:hypothetical protein